MGGIQIEGIRKVSQKLGDAVSDPSRWSDLLQELSGALWASGVALLPREGAAEFPRSPSVKGAFEEYIKGQWYVHDPRRRAIAWHLRGEVVSDDDLVTADEIRQSPFYNEFLPSVRVRWWAGAGFWAGSELWCLSVQRSAREGQFTSSEKLVLRDVAARLSEITTICQVVGRTSIINHTNALDYIPQPALALHYTGRVICSNASAERMFGDTLRISNGKLVIRDARAALAYSSALDRLRWAPDQKSLNVPPIVVRRADGFPLILQILPIEGTLRASFLGARALLTLREVKCPAAPDPSLLMQALGITAAEARLVARLATGETVEIASEALGVARETARNQLKSVFSKTDTHTQSRLVALLASIPRST